MLGWLDSLPKGTLDPWMVFDSVEPFGDEWRQTATIAQQASMDLCARAGVDAPKIEEFMPGYYHRQKTKTVIQIPSAEETKAMCSAFGAAFGMKGK